MEKPVRSKKQVILIEVIASVLCLASLGSLIVCSTLKDHGYGDFWWPLLGFVGFGVFAVASIGLLFFIRKDALTHEVESREQKIDTLPLKSLLGLYPGSVPERFLQHRFKDDGDGYLRRKMFSAAKDSICYYVKCVDSGDLKDLFMQQMNAIEQRKESGNVCLLLFVTRNGVDKEALEELRDLSKYYLACETVMPMPNWQSCVPILIDSSTNEGRFLDTNKKYPFSVYSQGCKLLNQYFD